MHRSELRVPCLAAAALFLGAFATDGVLAAPAPARGTPVAADTGHVASMAEVQAARARQYLADTASRVQKDTVAVLAFDPRGMPAGFDDDGLRLDDFPEPVNPLSPMWRQTWTVRRAGSGPRVMVFPFQLQRDYRWRGEKAENGILVPSDSLDQRRFVYRNGFLNQRDEEEMTRLRGRPKPKHEARDPSWAHQDTLIEDCLTMLLEMRMDTAHYVPLDLRAQPIPAEEWPSVRAAGLTRARAAEIARKAGAQGVLLGNLSLTVEETPGAGCRAWVGKGSAKLLGTANASVLRDARIKVAREMVDRPDCEEAVQEALNQYSFDLMEQLRGWEKPGSRLRDVRVGAWWLTGIGLGIGIQSHVMHVLTADDADALRRRGIAGAAAYSGYRRKARTADNWGTVAKVGYCAGLAGLTALGVTYAF